MTDPKVLSAQSIHDFFRELLSLAIENQRARVQQATELYLANLLSGFLQTESLLVRGEDGSLHRRPLALLLKEALEEEGAARARALRRLGDTSLFVSGMFSESLSASLVDVQYAIAMGSRAYDALGEVAARHGRGERSIWEELSAKFSQLVEVLNEVSERTQATTNAGLLRIYEKWIKTGSPRVATLLSERGVPAVLKQLARGAEAPWSHERLRGFCAAAEGVSHFLYLLHRARARRPVSQLELEAQGELDKYLCVLLQLWAVGRRRASPELRHRLFDRAALRSGLPAGEKERYRVAGALAAACARALETRFVVRGRLDGLLREARRLYRLGGGEKLSAFAQGQVAWAA